MASFSAQLEHELFCSRSHRAVANATCQPSLLRQQFRAFCARSAAEDNRHAPLAQNAPLHDCPHTSSLYPTPGSLTMYLGFAGSSPSFLRICATISSLMSTSAARKSGHAATASPSPPTDG